MRRLGIAVMVSLIVACTVSAGSNDAAYLLSEGVVDGPSRLTTNGASIIEVANIGEFSHTLVVTNDEGEVMAATGLIEPGVETTLAANLEPGTYVFSCRIVSQDDEGNLIDHFEGGMHRTVTVRT